MTVLQPCRFCGETEKLKIDKGVMEALWAVDAEGQVLRGETGEPTDLRVEVQSHLHYLDVVMCEACDADAPLRVWNSTPEFMATMLANVAAADAEYDDDGVWRGQPAVAA